MAGGITFEVAAPMIAGCVENGIDPDDVRVMTRTNEATKIILDTLIPVGGMMTADIVANREIVLLPKEMENAIEVEVLGGAKVRDGIDVTQGFYDILNQSTYVDPSNAHDNPMVDNGLVPDPTDPTILRRQYTYPGLQPSSTVRVTGAKRFLPITRNSDYLIVQNIEAVKLIILSIERFENNSPDDGTKYRSAGLELIAAEVKKHLLDPRNTMRRKAKYEDDLAYYAPNSMAWTRARMALEVPGAMTFGKSELTRILENAEYRIMEKGRYRGMIKELSAQVESGFIFFPKDVDAILAADFCGGPIDIRSEFFQFQENGPGRHSNSCVQALIDQGEEYFPTSRTTRRKYLLQAGTTHAETISVMALLRWIPKQPQDQMTIKHFEALRLMATAIVLERQEKWQEAIVNAQSAIQHADADLNKFLAGIKHTMPIQTNGTTMGDIGGML